MAQSLLSTHSLAVRIFAHIHGPARRLRRKRLFRPTPVARLHGVLAGTPTAIWQVVAFLLTNSMQCLADLSDLVREHDEVPRHGRIRFKRVPQPPVTRRDIESSANSGTEAYDFRSINDGGNGQN